MNSLLNEKVLGISEINQQNQHNLIHSQDAESIKPFISLTRCGAQTIAGKTTDSVSFTTASGKAIITYVISGEAAYLDSTGKRGTLKKDGWSWMIAGSGIGYNIEPITHDYLAIELGIALSPALENAAPQSAYLNPEIRTQSDPAQVLIGWHGKQRSHFAIPSLVNYLVVHLNAQQTWCYDLPLNHQFAWIAIISGRLDGSAGELRSDSLTLVRRPQSRIELHAQEDSILMLGSALEFAYDLVSHKNSVHTSPEALQISLQRIAAMEK